MPRPLRAQRLRLVYGVKDGLYHSHLHDDWPHFVLRKLVVSAQGFNENYSDRLGICLGNNYMLNDTGIGL